MMSNLQKKMGKADWDAVFKSLKAWQADLAVGEPSVSTIAELYKNDPWAVLVSTILSLRTKDEVTLRASEKLLAAAPTPSALFFMAQEDVEKLAYPVGFYRNKSASLKAIAGILQERYYGKVPDSMEGLLALPGVGRKTANLVLIEAFDKPGVCVDIHVHRITNRAGWLKTNEPDQTEMVLRRILPKEYWKSINALLVLYGQRVCKPVSPFCSRCVITDRCEGAGVDRRR